MVKKTLKFPKLALGFALRNSDSLGIYFQRIYFEWCDDRTLKLALETRDLAFKSKT